MARGDKQVSDETRSPSEMEVMRSRVASLEKQVYELQQRIMTEKGINSLAQAIERRIVSRLKYGRNPRIEISEETNK
jgi:hypothetical protein